MRVTRNARNACLREALLQRKAQARVMVSGDWLTWPEANALLSGADKGLTEPPPNVLLDGVTFSISYEGVEYFPRFAVEACGQALESEGMQRVIAILATRKSGWGMAYWFESSNSYLGGRLPKDVISSDPDAVVRAAQDEVDGISHG
ncbi:hypothetical protein ACQKF2_24070 [Pseudomonas hunanensis]|uniref:hypothetical protein n=1 Tax=Pseudomonas hunanensis TaxID=1247546 RepID=UPI003D01D798